MLVYSLKPPFQIESSDYKSLFQNYRYKKMSKIQIRAILFDLDETLLDRKKSLIAFCIWQATQWCFSAHQIQHYIERFLILDANGSVWKDQVYNQLKKEFEIKESVEQLLAIYLEHFHEFCVENDGVTQVVKALHEKGYLLGLISNGKSPFQERNFHHLGLSHYFSVIIISEAVQLRKPDTAIFHLACEQLKISPNQSVFVGDNELADVQGANKAGMFSVFFDKNHTNRTTKASFKISHFSNLINIINYLN